ncbi:MAG: hypothetical protein LC130_27335 [Bryobacterales bacterium]|nr:hypothetical protein [Bryobacterales bacterium]
MRTACVQVALTFALLCAPAVTPQTTEDGSRVQAETPARQKRPTRTGQPAQPGHGQTAVERPAYGIQNYSPLAAAGGYKRQQQTFWEFWWHQFNPRNINYGAWIEQRRRVFLEQAGENRYFWFSFWAFATICFLLLWAAKERMDRKDTEWEAAECLADLANYADYCKRHALEAIQKHNEHIEVCNRVIESEETGKPVMAGDVDGDWKAEVQRLRTEVAEKSAEVVKLSAALEQKSAAVTNLNERIDELARNQRAGGNAANANLDLVKRLNDLTSENHKLREELSKVKRAT